MTTLLNQLPALIGVIVGALGSYLATSRNEAARWKRQQTIRWDSERKTAYSNYAESVKSLSTHCGRIARSKGVDNSFQAIDLKEANTELLRLSAQRNTIWESILLLGSADTIAAGREWHRAVAKLIEFADGRRSDYDQWTATYRQAGAQRDTYYLQARRDLGVED